MRASATLFLLALTGCYQLDGFFFQPTALDAYALGGDVIPLTCQAEVSFDGEAGTLYGAWAHQPLGATADCEAGESNPDADVLVFFHGNADHIDAYWPMIEFFWESGFETFTFDYRGYGKSDGEPDHDGVLNDGAQAARYVIDATGRPSNDVVYVGLSLGGFVSIHIVDQFPPRAYITQDMFASAQTLLDQGTLLDIPQGWLFVESFDNLGAARRIPRDVPYLVVHGANDTYIQPANAQLVYDAAAADVKELFLVPNVDHADTIDVAPDVYRPWVECWARQDCAEQ